MHTTVAQNKAHREDLLWIKVAGGEYVTTNGWKIVKDNNTSRWIAFDENGQQATRLIDNRIAVNINESSLTWAKFEANAEIERRASIIA